MKFEWDETKEKANMAKHGLDFATAALVFGDVNRMEIYDDVHSSYEESRYITIGMIDKALAVIVVVYTERENATRIISARLATNKEKEAYYNGKNEY